MQSSLLSFWVTLENKDFELVEQSPGYRLFSNTASIPKQLSFTKHYQSTSKISLRVTQQWQKKREHLKSFENTIGTSVYPFTEG